MDPRGVRCRWAHLSGHVGLVAEEGAGAGVRAAEEPAVKDRHLLMKAR